MLLILSKGRVIMNDDKLLVSGLIGAVSTIPAEIASQSLIYCGLGKYSIYQLASLFITLNRPTFLLGLILDMLAGGFVAIIFYLAFRCKDSRNIGIMAVMTSLFAWLFCELVFTFFLEGRFFPLRPINDYYSNLISALIFGISLALLYKRFCLSKNIS